MSAWNKRKQRHPRYQLIGQRARITRLSPRKDSRRGVLLLVVLSMLTLFLMIGTAYIVTANQFRRANKTYAKAEQSAHSPAKQQVLINEVFNQILRDTNNQFSAIRYHSLLRDAYGNDGISIGAPSFTKFANRGSVSYTDDYGNPVDANTLDQRMALTGDQFFWVAVEFDIPVAPLLSELSQTDDYYNGTLFTFHNGDLRGVTTRVMDYDYAVTTNTNSVTGLPVSYGIFTLMALDSEVPIISQQLTNNNTITLNTRATINGRPFNGTGCRLRNKFNFSSSVNRWRNSTALLRLQIIYLWH